MSLTVSVRIEYVNVKKYDFQMRHDRRERKTLPKYINRELSGENEAVLDKKLSGKELLQTARELREKTPGKRYRVKDDAAVAYRGVITWGTEAQKVIGSLDKEKQKELYREIAERISKEAGLPLISLYVHRDEQAPHAHFTMYKFDAAGRSVSLKRPDLKRFQDIAGEVCRDFGLPITRGIPKEQRVAAGEPVWNYLHKTVRELHDSLPREIELRKKELRELEEDIARKSRERDAFRREIEELERELAERQKKNEKAQALLEKAKKELAVLIEKGQAESEKAEKLEKRISTYENRISGYGKEIAEAEKTLSEKKAELDATLKALEMYNKVLAERKEKAEEPEKLRAENARLKDRLSEMTSDIVKFGSRLSDVLETASDRTRQVVEMALDKARFDSPTVDLLLDAFYGNLEAECMRE